VNDEIERGKFHKILVAIDGSTSSMKAAEYAIEIAKKEGQDNTQLIALTVLDVSKPRSLLSSFIAAPTYGLKELEEERKAAQQWLDKIRQKAEQTGISFKANIIEGLTTAEETIINHADSEKVNLIIVGTRGRSGFSKVLLGSVASKVITYSSCPVLIIR
jgi:nucleotide-binding universal stress UspA family protein